MLKKIIFSFSLYHCCLVIQAQEKRIFSETFTDNRNNWPLIDKKGLKTSLSAGKYYDINNQSKDNYTSLVTVPLDSLADTHIVMTTKSLRWDDKNFAKLKGYCRFVIGAKDETSGYTVGMSENTLGISARREHPNSSPLDYQIIQIQSGDPDYLDMRIENNRWKFYSRNGNEIANTPARPMDGNKIGVFVYQPARYALTSVLVTEKEKNIIKTDFDLALFMFNYRKLLCSAWNMFKDDVGAQYGTPKDSTWYCKTHVPGFGFHTFLFVKKNHIELVTARKVNSLDEAFAYYAR